MPCPTASRPFRSSTAGQSALTRKDYASDPEVRLVPGCSGYIILNTVQSFPARLGAEEGEHRLRLGIGCSSRFPYYLDTFGMHSRSMARTGDRDRARHGPPDLSVWVVTGDGDALSIGGNHLIHALRRNVNLTILLFNNRIYGLTKGSTPHVRDREDHEVHPGRLRRHPVQSGEPCAGRGDLRRPAASTMTADT